MNWKLFQASIPDILKQKQVGWEFIIIPLVVLLYVGTALYLSRARQKKYLRQVIQIASLLIFGVVFTQCLCVTKMLVWTITNSISGQLLVALAFLWLPALNIAFVLLFGRYFYCYCICPIGFLQDITGKCNLHRNKAISLALLLVLLGVMGVVGWVKHPSPFIYGAGAWLGFLLIFVSILILFYPDKKGTFRKLRYFILPVWAVLAFTAYKVPGPWCVPAQAILSYSAIIPFIIALMVSAVFVRAWCDYICPDGALLRLFSGKLAKKNAHPTEDNA